jgi:hypothetical protein
MSNRFFSRLKKFTFGVIMFIVISIASLWVTSWALEPEPVGKAMAPDPQQHEEAIIQVYGADVWGFRGNFAIHTWIATKSLGAADYRIYQVIGWRLRRGRSVLSITEGNPARPWYGSPAILLHEIRGAEAEALTDRVHDAALNYPFEMEYKMWPGPNSNSFTAWIGLEVPELNLDLPFKAIGQSWMQSEYPALLD